MLGGKFLSKQTKEILINDSMTILKIADGMVLDPDTYNKLARCVVNTLQILDSLDNWSFALNTSIEAAIKKKSDQKDYENMMTDLVNVVLKNDNITTDECESIYQLLFTFGLSVGLDFNNVQRMLKMIDDKKSETKTKSEKEDDDYSMRDRFLEYYHLQQDGIISVKRACDSLNISKTVWYKLRKRYLDEIEE